MENNSNYILSVFTPTFNRLNSLQEAYKSLLNQTDKDFYWLIIDDGSTDSTSIWIEETKKVAPFKIDYFYKPNGGKHTATQLAAQKCISEYLLILDSDDTLLPQAVEFVKEKLISFSNDLRFSNVAEIRALSMNSDGAVQGNRQNIDQQLIGVPLKWHDLILKYKVYNEFIVCIKTSVLKEITYDMDDLWMKDKVKCLFESVLWARLGRKYDTVVYNEIIRNYVTNNSNSYLRSHKPKSWYYNELVTYKMFLDENIRYLDKSIKYFVPIFVKIGVMKFMLKISNVELLKQIKSNKVKIIYLLFYPLTYLLNIYYSKYKPNYWN